MTQCMFGLNEDTPAHQAVRHEIVILLKRLSGNVLPVARKSNKYMFS